MIQFLGEKKRGEGIVIVVQTDCSYEFIARVCQSTWLKVVLARDYDVAVIDYRLCQKSFIDILLLKEFESYSYVMPMFEDLYFSSFNVPVVNNILDIANIIGIDYLRLDGRPPEKEFAFSLDGISYGRISKSYRYMYSTVLACFSRDLLFSLREVGCSTAWDIENCTVYFSNNLYSVSKRTSKYRNLIVKGRIDVIDLIAVKELRIDLVVSFKRKLKRLIINLIQ